MEVFFFSSRRRQTRYIFDWSSDVCSSDLEGDFGIFAFAGKGKDAKVTFAAGVRSEIGRASCREREEMQQVREELNIKTQQIQHVITLAQVIRKNSEVIEQHDRDRD